MRRDRKEVDAELVDVDGYLSRALHRIDVERRAARASERRDLPDRLDDAGLIVREHDAHDGRIGGQGLLEEIEPHDAAVHRTGI